MTEPDNQGKALAKTFIVCGVVIEQNGRYLLVQEKQQRAYMQWNLPGGKVDEGESLEEAAIREAREECGYEVEIEKELLTLHLAVERPVMHAFKAKVISGTLKYPENEILSVDWFSYEDLKSGKVELRNPPYILGAIEADQK